MKKKLSRAVCAILACLTLLGSLCFASAVEFSDLEGHWSEPYILDLVERGYISGYTDGTVKPEKELSATEALVLLSRMYTTDILPAELSEQYAETAAAAANAAGMSWAANNIATALGSGIILPTELASIDLTQPIKKEQLSVFLARAMQLDDEAEALISVPLSFTDVYDISPENRCYIYILVKNGILTGNTSGTFSPDASVTRAVAATMVSRALEWLEANGGLEPILPPETYTAVSGLLVDYDANSIMLMDEYGVVRVWAVALDAELVADNAVVTWNQNYIGRAVTAYIAESTGLISSVKIDTATEYLYGTVLYGQNVGNRRTIATTSAGTVELAAGVSVYLDGVETEPAHLPSGSFILFTMSGSLATSARAYTATEITGVIEDITYGDSAVMLISSDDETFYCEVAPGNIPTVWLGDQKIDLTRLKQGDEVKVTLSAGSPTSISVTGQPEALSGRISRIASVSTDAEVVYTITLDLTSGVSKMYEVSGTVPVYSSDGLSIGVTSLAVGDNIKLSLYGGSIVEIVKTGASSSSSSVSGTVVGYNASTGELTLNVDGTGWVYVSAKTARVIVLVTGESSSLATLPTGSMVRVYGSSTDTYHYTATVVYIL